LKRERQINVKAHQDGDFVAIVDVGRRLSSPGVCNVNDIVMEQRGGVNHLGDLCEPLLMSQNGLRGCGKGDIDPLTLVGGHGHEEDKEGAKVLAALIKVVPGSCLEHGVVCFNELLDVLGEQREVLAHQCPRVNDGSARLLHQLFCLFDLFFKLRRGPTRSSLHS